MNQTVTLAPSRESPRVPGVVSGRLHLLPLAFPNKGQVVLAALLMSHEEAAPEVRGLAMVTWRKHQGSTQVQAVSTLLSCSPHILRPARCRTQEAGLTKAIGDTPV